MVLSAPRFRGIVALTAALAVGFTIGGAPDADVWLSSHDPDTRRNAGRGS